MEMYTQAVIGGLISSAPSLVAWIIAIILAAVFLRRRGGRAERFLLAGAGLMLVNSLLIIPGAAIVPYLVERGATMTDASFMVRSFNLVRGVVGMAGVICLVYAFWMKFNQAKSVKV